MVRAGHYDGLLSASRPSQPCTDPGQCGSSPNNPCSLLIASIMLVSSACRMIFPACFPRDLSIAQFHPLMISRLIGGASQNEHDAQQRSTRPDVIGETNGHRYGSWSPMRLPCRICTCSAISSQWTCPVERPSSRERADSSSFFFLCSRISSIGRPSEIEIRL